MPVLDNVGKAAHPRSRGEHSSFMSFSQAARGSSPLARGTLSHLPAISIINRLIPARAGNTVNTPPRGGGIRLIPARAGNTNL